MEPYVLRHLFVRFERSKHGKVLVLLDLNYLTEFYSEAKSFEEFEEECLAFSKSKKYEDALKAFEEGYNYAAKNT